MNCCSLQCNDLIHSVVLDLTSAHCRVQVRCSDTTNVASCGSSCDKLLACGRHYCKALCHTGNATYVLTEVLLPFTSHGILARRVVSDILLLRSLSGVL